ncbi:MAG: tetratricopeptide repeat protein, partial [Planctomycetaceae bacterium]
MITRPFISMPFAVVLTGVLSLPLRAQDEEDSSVPREAASKGYQLQRLDEPALPVEPVGLRTEAEQKQIEAQSWYMTGWLFKQREKYREALAAFEKATEARPDFAQAYMALIEVSLHLRDSAKVVEYAKKAVEHDPGNFQLLRQLGVEMVKNRQLKPAIQYLEQALNSAELDHKSRFFVLINRDLGIIYNGIGETEKAGTCYEVVLDALLHPAMYDLDSRTRDELQKHASTSFERIGQVLLAADRTELALKALEKAVSERKGKPGQVNLLLAEVYHRTEDYARGLEQLDLFFESGQSQGRDPFVLLGTLLEKLDQSGTLIERLEALVKKDARNQDLRFFLAATYAAAERLDEAEEIYRAALDRKPSSEAYLGLAGIYRQRGKPEELLENLSSVLDRQQELQAVAVRFEAEMKAIEADEKLLEALLEAGRDGTREGVGPNDFSRVFFLARLAARADRTDAAVEFFRLALKAAPSRAESVLGGLGQALLDADRFGEAAEVYQEAIANPLAARSKPDNFLRKALALEMAGRTEDALEA